MFLKRAKVLAFFFTHYQLFYRSK